MHPHCDSVKFYGYLVTRDGRVFSPHSYYQKQMKGYLNKQGYRMHTLSIDGKSQMIGLHRLLAFCFIGPPPYAGAVVRHLDDNPLNNKLENLAWGTVLDNTNDRDRNGRTSKGKRHAELVRQGKARAALAK